jgi:hypothetical protein
MIYGANANFTYNFKSQKLQKIKMGLSNYYRDRKMIVDALGYSSLTPYGVTIPETKDVTFSTIFSPENIDANNLTLAAMVPTQRLYRTCYDEWWICYV